MPTGYTLEEVRAWKQEIADLKADLVTATKVANGLDMQVGELKAKLAEKDAEIERCRNALMEIAGEDTVVIECINDPDIATSKVVGDCAKIAKAALADTEGKM
jgi:predicted  nucleic acid-binding Zn-ribbon protein